MAHTYYKGCGREEKHKKNKERKVVEKEGKHKKPGGARQKKTKHEGYQKDMQIYTGGDSTITVKKESGVRL